MSRGSHGSLGSKNPSLLYVMHVKWVTCIRKIPKLKHVTVISRTFFLKIKTNVTHVTYVTHVMWVTWVPKIPKFQHVTYVTGTDIFSEEKKGCHACHRDLTDIFQTIKMYVTHVTWVTWVTRVQKSRPLICHTCQACQGDLEAIFSENQNQNDVTHVTWVTWVTWVQTFISPVPYIRMSCMSHMSQRSCVGIFWGKKYKNHVTCTRNTCMSNL